MVNAEKWNGKLQKWEPMSTCYRLTFVLLALSFQLPVFLKLRIMNTLVHFVMSVMPHSQERIPKLDQKVLSPLAEYDYIIIRLPLSALSPGP